MAWTEGIPVGDRAELRPGGRAVRRSRVRRRGAAVFGMLFALCDGAEIRRRAIAHDTITAPKNEKPQSVGDEELGLTLEIASLTDVLAPASGGIRRRVSAAGILDLLVSIDAEKLVGWKNATFFVQGLGMYGRNPSDDIGDAQTVSSIAAPHASRLYELWLQQNLLGHRLSLLAGLYVVSAEFDVLRSAQLFVHSSFGTNPEFASAGRNGIPTFPLSALALRAQAILSPSLILRSVIADGVPGDPDDPRGTHIALEKTDGVLVATELAYVVHAHRTDPTELRPGESRPGVFQRTGRMAEIEYDAKYSIGAWVLTTDLDDLDDRDAAGAPITRDGSYGVYGIGEHLVYREPAPVVDGHPKQGLVLFFQLGHADSRVNRFSDYLGGGVVYAGLFPGRDRDQTGVAIAIAHNGQDWKAGERAAGRVVESNEIALELTHEFVVFDSVILQPDFQYVINPGTDPTIPNAFIVGGRLELRFTWLN